jgi:hypothetical protein
LISAVGENGVLRFDAAFLTLQDLIECVGRVAQFLGGDTKRPSRHTLQGWLKAGLLGMHTKDRELRNRLFDGRDLLRASVLSYFVGATKTSGKLAGVLADQVEHYFRAGSVKALSPSAVFNSQNCILASTVGGGWEILVPTDQRELERRLMRSGLSIVLNYQLLCHHVMAQLSECLNRKLRLHEADLEKLISAKRGNQ